MILKIRYVSSTYNWYFNMGYTDEQLRNAVDAVFSQFDADNSGALDANEVHNLINAAMKHLNAGK